MAEVTNYIDRLVAELCPDGVEYRPLGEVGEFIRGNGLQKKDLFLEGMPVIHYGQVFTHYGAFASKAKSYTDFELYSKLRKADPGDLVIATTSENDEDVCKAVAWLGEEPVGVSGDAYIYRHSFNAKYIAYFFMTHNFQRQKIRHITGTKVRRVSGKSLETILAPMPPMEIQEAIVEILDKFTNLEAELGAELEAELEARTLQYEYYRDSLFEALDCPRATLGELGKFYGGLKGKTKNDFGASGARYISYKNVYENISADFTWPDFVQVKEGENQLSLMKGDILLTGSSENMEEAGLSSVVTKEPEEKAYLNSFSICYRLNDPSILNPEFSKYLFRSRLARKQIIRTAQGVTRFNVSKKKLANVSIPIPSLEEQQRVVDILDRFDSLTSSLSEGLPAELAARRSQYEYYRDQLLTFPRKGENQ